MACRPTEGYGGNGPKPVGRKTKHPEDNGKITRKAPGEDGGDEVRVVNTGSIWPKLLT